MNSLLRTLKNRLARLGSRVSQAAPEDLRALEAATLRLVVVLEHVATRLPGYEPPRLLSDDESAALAAWDGYGALPITLDPAHAAAWFARLAGCLLVIDGWQRQVFDHDFRVARVIEWDRQFRRAREEGWPTVWRQDKPERPRFERARLKILDDVAESLARIEGGGVAAPRWLPRALASEARSLTALKEKILNMNSEQRWMRLRELSLKAAVVATAVMDETSPPRLDGHATAPSPLNGRSREDPSHQQNEETTHNTGDQTCQ